MSMNGIRGTKGNNARNKRTTFPDVRRRQEAAAARKAVSDARPPQEQLVRLDQAFGVGVGAKKERAKLAARMAKKDTSATKEQKREKMVEALKISKKKNADEATDKAQL